MLVTIRLTLPFATFGMFAESSVPTVPFIGVSMSGWLSSYWPLVPTVSLNGLFLEIGRHVEARHEDASRCR
jgi:hypothetical protein